MMETKNCSIELLKEHPKNYKQHPEEQLSHLIESIKKNSLYRPVIISNDCFILAGHGLVKALKKMGVSEVPVFQVNISHDSPQALKILVGDNEIQHLTDLDDHKLCDILKEINNND